MNAQTKAAGCSPAASVRLGEAKLSTPQYITPRARRQAIALHEDYAFFCLDRAIPGRPNFTAWFGRACNSLDHAQRLVGVYDV